MKRETINLIEVIYNKMLEKTAKRLRERQADNQFGFEEVIEGMGDAFLHPMLLMSCFGAAEYVDFETDILSPQIITFQLTMTAEEVSAIKVTDEMYVDFIRKSFELVYDQDMLSELLGVDEYVDIIEEANILVMQGIDAYEGIDGNVKEEIVKELGKKYGIYYNLDK